MDKASRKGIPKITFTSSWRWVDRRLLSCSGWNGNVIRYDICTRERAHRINCRYLVSSSSLLLLLLLLAEDKGTRALFTQDKNPAPLIFSSSQSPLFYPNVVLVANKGWFTSRRNRTTTEDGFGHEIKATAQKPVRGDTEWRRSWTLVLVPLSNLQFILYYYSSFYLRTRCVYRHHH